MDIEEERVDIQLLILFDMKDIFEYLSLYEMFVNNVYYKKFYEDIWHKADELCEKNIKVVIRNLGSNSDLSFECYSHLFCADGALSMLEKEGIVPDYVTNLDFTDLAMKFFQNKENKTSLNILSCATYPNLVHFLDNKSVILRDDPLYR